MFKAQLKNTMIIKAIALGTVCSDKATRLKGTLTHWLLDMDGKLTYLFQPEGLNPKNGQPLSKMHLPLARLNLPEGCHEEIEVPFEVLGSHVKDKASGFNGMAVGFIRHINGCFHVLIQPEGRLATTNSPVDKSDFDLRGCEGEKIPKLTPGEIRVSKTTHPSPTDIPRECLESC